MTNLSFPDLPQAGGARVPGVAPPAASVSERNVTRKTHKRIITAREGVCLFFFFNGEISDDDEQFDFDFDSDSNGLDSIFPDGDVTKK